MSKFKIGDAVKKKDGTRFSDGKLVNFVREPDSAYSHWPKGAVWVKNGWIGEDKIELAYPEIKSLKDCDTKPDGGPSTYYDFPFQDWTTVNDMVEYLADKQWGKHSWIFKDILKACTRWGAKEGTEHSYDAKKIIYYGCRLLMSVTDKKTLQDYLQQLLDDKQFKE